MNSINLLEKYPDLLKEVRKQESGGYKEAMKKIDQEKLKEGLREWI